MVKVSCRLITLFEHTADLLANLNLGLKLGCSIQLLCYS